MRTTIENWWTPQKIDWYTRASQYSNFHKELALEISKLIPKEKTILEVGCGLGYITLELQALGYNIFGIDKDIDAIEKAIEFSKKENPTFAIEDYTTTNRKASVVLAVFCGRIDEEGLEAFKRIAEEQIIYIISKHKNNSLRCNKTEKICTYLEQNGYCFNYKELLISFDQPFKDLSEAKEFFTVQYGNETLKAVPSNSYYRDLFPYTFENEKKMSLFDIKLKK